MLSIKPKLYIHKSPGFRAPERDTSPEALYYTSVPSYPSVLSAQLIKQGLGA